MNNGWNPPERKEDPSIFPTLGVSHTTHYEQKGKAWIKSFENYYLSIEFSEVCHLDASIT